MATRDRPDNRCFSNHQKKISFQDELLGKSTPVRLGFRFDSSESQRCGLESHPGPWRMFSRMAASLLTFSEQGNTNGGCPMGRMPSGAEALISEPCLHVRVPDEVGTSSAATPSRGPFAPRRNRRPPGRAAPLRQELAGCFGQAKRAGPERPQAGAWGLRSKMRCCLY